ncbi:phage late control D family protein [Massilia oculi]|uniref:phage late control D family protein n=1 Tax=Massilia oculi TaxID=945844 RepID=UPI001E2A342D|nr:phage late control D family protein [Massilia oculi]
MVSSDAPGQNAYPSRNRGQRIADNQMEALETRSECFVGAGTVRTMAPGSVFALTGHACHDKETGRDARRFIVTRVRHLMHNNLTARIQAPMVTPGRAYFFQVAGYNAAQAMKVNSLELKFDMKFQSNVEPGRLRRKSGEGR